jgi:hypothetical protein
MFGQAERHGDDLTECECGWSDVYSLRFGINNFPCVHPCHQHPVDFQTQRLPNIQLSFDTTIRPPVCRDDTGTDWSSAVIQAGNSAGDETLRNIAMGAKEMDDGLEPDVNVFVR